MAKKNRKIEELWNVITHGTGAILSFIALVVMVLYCIYHNGTLLHIVAAVVFGSSLVLLYSASTAYHWAWTLRRKRTMQRIDHLCIYVLIAGSYTPIALLGLRGAWGWTIFGLIWSFAIAGFIFKFSPLRKSEKISLTLYALMGWLIIIAIKPLIENLATGALLYLLGGGLCYTFGIYFYAKDKMPYNHTIWHLFVLGGSTLHFLGVFLYLIP
jgi:hemolysin III